MFNYFSHRDEDELRKTQNHHNKNTAYYNCRISNRIYRDEIENNYLRVLREVNSNGTKIDKYQILKDFCTMFDCTQKELGKYIWHLGMTHERQVL